MRTLSESECETFICPHCELSLHGVRGREGLRINYDITRWQKHCVAAKLGTPCVCPQFRPSLWRMLQEANRLPRSR